MLERKHPTSEEVVEGSSSGEGGLCVGRVQEEQVPAGPHSPVSLRPPSVTTNTLRRSGRPEPRTQTPPARFGFLRTDWTTSRPD